MPGRENLHIINIILQEVKNFKTAANTTHRDAMDHNKQKSLWALLISCFMGYSMNITMTCPHLYITVEVFTALCFTHTYGAILLEI